MRLVHDPTDGDSRTLATEVAVAESLLDQAMGLRFRPDLPEDYAYVMEVGGGESRLPLVGGPATNLVDMFFMRVPLDIVWLIDEEVVAVQRMQPWRSLALETADTIVELPAGTADDVAVGDRLRLVES
jgi:uncharacterized membrane protein (UPF0127 family)